MSYPATCAECGATYSGIVTRIDCPESECPTCTEEDPNV